MDESVVIRILNDRFPNKYRWSISGDVGKVRLIVWLGYQTANMIVHDDIDRIPSDVHYAGRVLIDSLEGGR